MFLSHRGLRGWFCGLLTIGAAALLLARPAAAQQPRTPPRIPPDARGFQRTMLMQEQLRQRTAARPAPAAVRPTAPEAVRATMPAAPQALVVTVTRPPDPTPLYVAIRGPDGSVQTFPVEGGQASIQTQTYLVRPGESIKVQVMAQPPAK